MGGVRDGGIGFGGVGRWKGGRKGAYVAKAGRATREMGEGVGGYGGGEGEEEEEEEGGGDERKHLWFWGIGGS